MHFNNELKITVITERQVNTFPFIVENSCYAFCMALNLDIYTERLTFPFTSSFNR